MEYPVQGGDAEVPWSRLRSLFEQRAGDIAGWLVRSGGKPPRPQESKAQIVKGANDQSRAAPHSPHEVVAALKVAEQAAEKKATARAERTKMDLIVSRVDGSFNGLTGRTVIRLEDGTVWKQANADDRFRPKVTDHPAAAVIHGIFGYKMRIEGTQEFYVDPVRHP